METKKITGDRHNDQIQNSNRSYSKESESENSSFNSLYVGDLSLNVSETDLSDIFSKFGPIDSVKLFCNNLNNKSLGFCHINYKNLIDAKKALENLNFYSDSDTFLKPIRIMWNYPDDSIRKSGDGNLFVKNLPSNFGSKSLFELFSSFGNILSSKIVSDEEGNSLCYGFVHFEKLSSKIEAIENLNGAVISNKKIFVGPFLKKQQRGEITKPKFTNIYIKNLDFDKCTIENIRDIFGVFGEITSIFIPKKEDQVLGFVFVNFLFSEDAEEAIFNMNNKKIGKSTLFVGKAETKIERQRFLKKNLQKKISLNLQKLIQKKLLIGNIPDGVKTGEIISQFSGHGRVIYHNVVKKSDNRTEKIVFLALEKPKYVKEVLDKVNFPVYSKSLFLESWEGLFLVEHQSDVILLKKTPINEANGAQLIKNATKKKKKKRVQIKKKKNFFRILKLFTSKEIKKVCILVFFFLVKKLDKSTNKVRTNLLLALKIRHIIHLLFCKKFQKLKNC